jgi:hypothetical protein
MTSGTIKWAGTELAYEVEVSSWGSPSSMYDPGGDIEFDVTELLAGDDGHNAMWLYDTTHADDIDQLIYNDIIASAKHDAKYRGD